MRLVRQRPRALTAIAAVIAVVLVLGGLKASAAVTMPLAFALLITILASPLQRWLSRYMPHGAAFALTLIAIAAVFAAFVFGLVISAQEIMEGAGRYAQALEKARKAIENAASQVGVSLDLSSSSLSGSGSELAKTAALSLVDVGGKLVLCVALLVLALYEAPRWRRRVLAVAERHGTNADLGKMFATLGRNFRRYFATRTLTSGITGVLTGLFTWAIGLDFPIVWGVSSFLLNYIPTLGSIVAIIPPTLLAYVQFDSVAMAAATFGGLGFIQLAMGSFIDPRLQSRFVEVSGFIVLLSIALWGWIWGIPGALLGVPMAILIILVSRELPASSWIGELMTEDEDEG